MANFQELWRRQETSFPLLKPFCAFLSSFDFLSLFLHNQANNFYYMRPMKNVGNISINKNKFANIFANEKKTLSAAAFRIKAFLNELNEGVKRGDVLLSSGLRIIIEGLKIGKEFLYFVFKFSVDGATFHSLWSLSTFTYRWLSKVDISVNLSSLIYEIANSAQDVS